MIATSAAEDSLGLDRSKLFVKFVVESEWKFEYRELGGLAKSNYRARYQPEVSLLSFRP